MLFSQGIVKQEISLSNHRLNEVTPSSLYANCMTATANNLRRISGGTKVEQYKVSDSEVIAQHASEKLPRFLSKFGK